MTLCGWILGEISGGPEPWCYPNPISYLVNCLTLLLDNTSTVYFQLTVVIYAGIPGIV